MYVDMDDKGIASGDMDREARAERNNMEQDDNNIQTKSCAKNKGS